MHKQSLGTSGQFIVFESNSTYRSRPYVGTYVIGRLQEVSCLLRRKSCGPPPADSRPVACCGTAPAVVRASPSPWRRRGGSAALAPFRRPASPPSCPSPAEFASWHRAPSRSSGSTSGKRPSSHGVGPLFRCSSAPSRAPRAPTGSTAPRGSAAAVSSCHRHLRQIGTIIYRAPQENA